MREESTDTEKVLYAMMLEDTGARLTDSGSLYGRSYSAAREKYPTIESIRASEVGRISAFPKESASGNLKVDWYPIVNTFHYLNHYAVYEGELDLMVSAFVAWIDNSKPYLSWGWLKLQDYLFDTELMEEFASDMKEEKVPLALTDAAGAQHRAEDVVGRALQFVGSLGGLTSPGRDRPIIINTYNYENLLDRTMQYVPLEVDREGTYYLLSLHGGCDALWGYTRPRFFSCSGVSDGGLAYLDESAYLYSEEGDVSWYTTDSGSTFMANDGSADPLRNYPHTKDSARRGKGLIYVDDNDQLHCPVSGGRLLVGL